VFAPDAGISSFLLLRKYALEIKKENKSASIKMEQISKSIEKGKSKINSYEDYLDKEIIRLIKVAEEKKIPEGVVFKQYSPVKKMADKYKKKIKTSLYSPIAVYAVISLVFSNVLQNFASLNDIGEGFSGASLYLMDNYLYITGSILAVLIYLLMTIPEKLPVLKKIFHLLDSIIALTVVAIMVEKMGYSSSEVISMMKKNYNLIPKRRIENNAEGLVNLLKQNKIISPFEGADIKLSIEFGKLGSSIDDILENRLSDIDMLDKITEEIVKNISLIMSALPFLLTLIVFKDILRILTSTM
jgi:hypothetical protein